MRSGSSRMSSILRYLLITHFIAIELFWYYHYLTKWLITEHFFVFLRKLFP